MGKMKRSSFKSKTESSTSSALELIHMDLCGPMRTVSINEKKYLLVIIDDYSRYTWLEFLRNKSNAPELIIAFIKRIQVRLQLPVQTLHSDNGMEFKNYTLQSYLISVGISHYFSAAYTPRQNGIVEQKNSTLVEAARTMLAYADLPMYLWAEAVATSCFTHNRTTVVKRFHKTTYELINNRKPNIKFLRVFGCRCYILRECQGLSNFHKKTDEGYLVGYSLTSKAYRIYNTQTKTIVESMNVSFDENSTRTSEHNCSELGLKHNASIQPGIEPTSKPSSSSKTNSISSELDLLFIDAFDEICADFDNGITTTTPSSEVPALVEDIYGPSEEVTQTCALLIRFLQSFGTIEEGLIEIRWKNQILARQTEEHARSEKRASSSEKRAMVCEFRRLCVSSNFFCDLRVSIFKMGYSSDDDEKKIEKLELENKNLASSVDYYSKRSKRYNDERKILREEVSALKTINEDLLKQTFGLNEQKVLFLEAENTELKNKISELEDHIVKFQQTGCANEKKIFELELQIVEERSVFDKEKKEFAKKFSEFSRKCVDEKKTIELKCLKLSQQISEFEKVIILEREKFAKERKTIDQKNLSELSTTALKDQKAKSEFKKEIDLHIKEKNRLSSKIKELEKIVSKVVVTEQTPPESQIHTPRNNSADFKKTASSSHLKIVSSRRLVNSFDQIRTTNIFYDRKIDGSGTHRRRRRYEKEKLVWKVKPVEDEKNNEKKEEKRGKKEEKTGNKSIVSASNAKKNKVLKGKPDLAYSRDQLIRTRSSMMKKKCYSRADKRVCSDTQKRKSTFKGEYIIFSGNMYSEDMMNYTSNEIVDL
ncbi:hypothetical protein L6452_38750 [Arctium lappa]|uniref:Uncharacterized protein n=1 Tax=Arctium lappa TaxID=4217 RepID=A0ACB8XRJ9_ARCLA|nr:hypothetical protein L6452_38750 [Arctium lappa]